LFAGNIFEVRETHPLLIEALLDEEPDIAKAAARGLSVLGRDAAAAVPNFVAVLDAEIGKIESGSPWERDERSLLVSLVCQTLGTMGTAAQPAIPALRRARKHGDPDLRSAAREALSEMGFRKDDATLPPDAEGFSQ
jgi:HEAT repeat protein